MHNIEHFTYNENANLNKIEKEIDAYVKHETWEEGGGGLPNPIRWCNVICDNYEEAERYIEEHDRGWYDQLAVKYREYPPLEPSKTLNSLREKLKNEFSKKALYIEAHSVSTFKAEFIGCPGCGSKLKRTLLRGEYCPLCRAELRGKTTVETIERYEKNILDLQKKIKEETLKIEKKNTAKSKIRWIVKIEYHT